MHSQGLRSVPSLQEVDGMMARRSFVPRPTIRNTIESQMERFKMECLDRMEEDGYRVQNFITRGSFSTLREATYNDEEIAVKVYDVSVQNKEFLTKFFPRELEAWTKLTHPNIVRIHKVYQFTAWIYIFMERLRGGELLQLVLKKGSLDEEVCHHYFKQILDAVLYLHEQNVAHRSLTLNNIMLHHNNTIKLIDFSLCRRTDVAGRPVLSETFCGSVPYSAPEMLLEVPYNALSTDVWSLGCCLFIMKTGNFPSRELPLQILIKEQLTKKLRIPIDCKLSDGFKDIISRMLEPDIQKRWTAKELYEHPWITKIETTEEETG